MGKVYVIGTCDTKAEELTYARDLITSSGVEAVLVDVGTTSSYPHADIGSEEVARFHGNGRDAIFAAGDRGKAVSAMAEALTSFLASQTDIGAVLGMGGTGNTALVTQALRSLPIGVPKIMVSTVASGNVAPYVGANDITMTYSVVDVAGLNKISRRVIANAAHAAAGMVRQVLDADVGSRQALGITMFGVTTPCVTQLRALIGDRFDTFVFHATGVGGQSMEKLVDSGLIDGVIDVTTTEVADMLVGGVFASTPDRFGAIIRSGVPYVGSVGALDMVNFGAMESVPEKFGGRHLHVHNSQVTLMRTTVDENIEIGQWIASRLNEMQGPVRFLIPLKGVSALDKDGQPFHDPHADQALFATLKRHFNETRQRQLIDVDAHINDAAFVSALYDNFNDIKQ